MRISKRIHVFLSILMIAVGVLGTTSCSSSSIARKQRAVDQRMAQTRKDEAKELERRKEKHMEMQSERSRKMMKEARKKAKRLNKQRRRSTWLTRFLGIEKRHRCRN